LQLTKEKSNE